MFQHSKTYTLHIMLAPSCSIYAIYVCMTRRKIDVFLSCGLLIMKIVNLL